MQSDVERDAERYRFIRENFEWIRVGVPTKDESYALIGVKVPFDALPSSPSDVDYLVDRAILKATKNDHR